MSTDAQLVQLVVTGDSAAFRELVIRHQSVAQRAAYVATGWLDTDDIVQEAFAKAFLTLDRLRAGEAFRPWLVAIVMNEAKNRLRSRDRRAALTARLGQVLPTVPPSAEDAAMRAAERDAVLAAVNTLGEADREVISYRYFLDLSESETAQALNCPPGTIKSRLHRALTRLRTMLVEEKAG